MATQSSQIMKKILLAGGLKDLFAGKGGFLERAGIAVYTAYTYGQMLKIHQKEGADLIVTELTMPDMRAEDFFETIRNSEELRQVSSIIICEDTLDHREQCKRCRANAVFTMPVDVVLLLSKAGQFLNVAPRKSYRAPLAVAIQGKFREKPRPFYTENISARGMLIRSEEPLAKGDGVFFSFFLPDGTHASGYGEIARTDRTAARTGMYLYGIRFTNIDPAVETAIEEAIRKMK
jgi:CheY-like chemotaxis protein